MKKVANDIFFAWVEEGIAQGKTVRFRLKGNSMFPLLRNGKDEVTLEKCPNESLKPMDWYCSATEADMYCTASCKGKEIIC